MLHRSASSRRRRASPSVANLNQPAGASSVIRGRRASVATEKPLVLPPSSPGETMERQRSPRGSMVPDIALDTEGDSPDEGICRRILPDPEQYLVGRSCLAPEASRSPRNSLIPDDYCRSPRGSLVPDPSRSPRNSLVPDVARTSRSSLTPEVSLSPRHSLIPDSVLSPRNSLVPDVAYNRSPRNSMAASRISLMPENGNTSLGATRSPRHSLVPDSTRSPRGSMANLDFDRSPRGSICPEVHRTPRGSITPMEVIDRSPRGSIASECLNQSPRGSIAPDPNRSPRGSIVPDSNRSPRGSICPEGNRSPRGSIVPHEQINRSPRGSLGMNDVDRHSRGSLGAVNDDESRSPRGSIGPDGVDRSPRGSLGGMQDRRMPRSLNPRRASADQGDESRRLCASGAKAPEKGDAEAANVGVATYGSVVFQLKDAHLEANGICDFVFRALRVISKTMTFTICLSCLSTVPILMFIFGVQFIKDCPIEPYIPVYMLIGGVLGAVRMFWALYSQIRSRRPEVLSVPGARPHVSPMKLLSIALSCFLVGWFALGHYWILHIKWPEYEFSLYAPNKWCHKTLYIFSLNKTRERRKKSAASDRDGGWRLDRRKVLEDLQEEEDDDDDYERSGDADPDEDDGCNKIVQEVKFSSKVQFRAPDIIEL
ncbi:hypothetical protein EAI_02313 [Harpegnathos saltator]|uniref:Uncharacterized protein n=1 Tax=Harpegnathos saltator TaxID=610380 RepID=E2BZK2_HARSA|nr:hypothetical protein EAI_02313 [Harpegnathos saltator]